MSAVPALLRFPTSAAAGNRLAACRPRRHSRLAVSPAGRASAAKPFHKGGFDKDKQLSGDIYFFQSVATKTDTSKKSGRKKHSEKWIVKSEE